MNNERDAAREKIEKLMAMANDGRAGINRPISGAGSGVRAIGLVTGCRRQSG